MNIIAEFKSKHVIEIIVYDRPEFSNVAASRVTHPKSIKRKFKYSEQQLADFNDLVESVISVINYYQFEIINEIQSHKSYAYYIEFIPTDDNGDKWDESICIKFRLADHSNLGAESSQLKQRVPNANNHKITFVKSFCIGSRQYPGPMSVVVAVRNICKHLKNGDYAILDSYSS